MPLYILLSLHNLERVITEHTRAVNRICFQPDNGNILLSASQDGNMKCWVRDTYMIKKG